MNPTPTCLIGLADDTHALLDETLTLLGQRDIDPTPLLYAKFFERLPSAREMFGRVDEVARGRMCHEIFCALLDAAQQRSYLPGLVQVYVNDHRPYGHIDLASYRLLLDALCDALAELLADDWTPARSAAWRSSVETLMGMVEQAEREAIVPVG